MGSVVSTGSQAVLSWYGVNLQVRPLVPSTRIIPLSVARAVYRSGFISVTTTLSSATPDAVGSVCAFENKSVIVSSRAVNRISFRTQPSCSRV